MKGMLKIKYIFALVSVTVLISCKGNTQLSSSATSRGGMKENEWTITQYSDISGSQAGFYTIRSDKGTMIVIDGGTENNAEYVKQVLAENGGHVGAWILTHPHPDHIGAFNSIMEEGEVSVDTIYDNGIDYEFYVGVAQEWNGISTYEKYLELTAEWPEVQSLKIGDELTFDNLKIIIINSYYPGMERITGDIPNNSSLAFTVTVADRSMLFVGDCHGKKIAEKWISDYGEKLKCDYAQMGHHGNNSLPISFYEYVEPQAAFFDAPDWLIEGEKYDTRTNMEAMEQIAETVFDYRTSPNQVILS